MWGSYEWELICTCAMRIVPKNSIEPVLQKNRQNWKIRFWNEKIRHDFFHSKRREWNSKSYEISEKLKRVWFLIDINGFPSGRYSIFDKPLAHWKTFINKPKIGYQPGFSMTIFRRKPAIPQSKSWNTTSPSDWRKY